MMTLDDFAKEQLGYTYSRIEFDQDASSKIRNWCITVWMGALAILSSDRLHLTGVQKTMLSVMPILFFWFLDALQHTLILFHGIHARKLESFLLGIETFDAEQVQIYSLAHRCRVYRLHK
jgi:hypothetical protein